MGIDEPRHPRLVGRRVRLRPVGAADHELLRRIELSPHLAHRWRHHGTTPGIGEWRLGHDQGVLAQYLVVDTRDGGEEWVGLVAAFNAHFEHGFAYLGVARLGELDRSTRALEGAVLFLDHLFTTWPLRTLYAESPVWNLDQFSSGTRRLLREVARLPDHWYLDGRHWDHVILSITRERWEEHGPGLLAVCQGEAS